MRLVLFITLLFMPVYMYAQGKPYAAIDDHAISTGYFGVQQLAEKLTVNCASDSEKARSLFRWIAEHIGYDVIEFHKANRALPVIPYEGTDSVGAMARYYTNFAEQVIKRRKAVCEGYATLFKVLCDNAGLESVIIHGCSRNSLASIGKGFTENHAWNAIKLNGTWRLLDPCWGSGNCNADITKFTKSFNEFYFCTPPELFVYNHYPTDTTWLQMGRPPTREEFAAYPHFMAPREGVASFNFSPATGLIKAHIGDTVRITIESSIVSAPQEGKTPLSRLIEFDAGNAIINFKEKDSTSYQASKVVDHKLLYEYKVWSKDVRTLFLDHNMQYLCAYKLEVEE